MAEALIRVLYEDNHLLCLEKPVNVPVQQDESRDDDMLSLGRAYLKERYGKPGNVFLGLVHRLDRPVGGAMVFARTSKAASRLSETIRKNEMEKEYLAVTDGIPPKDSGTLKDWLQKDSRTNTVSVTDEAHGKYCELEYQVLETRGTRALVRIRLITGRPHQIRVQFASRSLPLVHDRRYNPHPGKGQIALWSHRLVFPHPTKKETVEVISLPPLTDPWREFEVIRYDKKEKAPSSSENA